MPVFAAGHLGSVAGLAAEFRRRITGGRARPQAGSTRHRVVPLSDGDLGRTQGDSPTARAGHGSRAGGQGYGSRQVRVPPPSGRYSTVLGRQPSGTANGTQPLRHWPTVVALL